LENIDKYLIKNILIKTCFYQFFFFLHLWAENNKTVKTLFSILLVNKTAKGKTPFAMKDI